LMRNLAALLLLLRNGAAASLSYRTHAALSCGSWSISICLTDAVAVVNEHPLRWF